MNALGSKPDDSLGKVLLAKYGSADVIMVGDCTARGGTYYRANHEAIMQPCVYKKDSCFAAFGRLIGMIRNDGSGGKRWILQF
ncbi:MAG: hypothetical protein ACLR1V_02355 [Coprococcus sp.]